ncbi:helix-turn-helix domain-containing protein, partial [Bacillus paranthracis]|nr:helix-turn-helix domain-containing protein [Bacillus paranthracis]
KEAAEILNVAPSTVFTYIKSGKLAASKIEKRGKEVYIIDKDDLETFQLTYEKTTSKERKTFIAKIQDEDIYLYQLLTHQHTGKIARVIEINRADGKILTEDEEIFPLSTYKEHNYSFEPFHKQAVITKRGYLSFSFKKPQLFNSITYNLINLFYKELGVTNMRLSISSDTIKLEIKPFVLQVDPLQFQEEIKYLHSHKKSGTILPHVEGVYFKSNVEPLTFHADHEFKQKVVQMAAGAGMGQEEFLLQAVKSYIRNLEQQ